MRQMIDEFVEKPKVDETEDRLEVHSLSRKEQRAYKKQKFIETTMNMTKTEKFKYVLYYYKWPAIIAIILICCACSIGTTIYKNSRPISIAYAIINCADPLSFNTAAIDDYVEAMGLSDGYRIVDDTSIVLDPEKYKNEYFSSASTSVYTEFPALCYNGYFDIVISDEKGIVYCGMQDIIYPVDNYLDADLYKAVEGRIYETTDHEGDTQEFAINISDTDFAKSLNLGYDDVYLAFPGVTEQNFTSAYRVLRYVLGISAPEN